MARYIGWEPKLGELRKARILLGLVLAVFIVLLALADTTAGLDRVIFDQAVRFYPPPASKSVALVALDDRTMRALGRWPWSRGVHAQALESVERLHPRSILYDVVFLGVGRDEQGDADLARAIRRYGNVYLVPSTRTVGTDGKPYAYDNDLPVLVSAAKAVGQAFLKVDPDGTTRSIELTTGREALATHVAVLMTSNNPTTRRMLDQLGPAGGARAPPLFSPSSTRLIPYGPNGSQIPTVSMLDVMSGRVDPQVLNGRYVVIGATAPNYGDQYVAAGGRLGEMTPDALLQAKILDAIVNNRALVPAPLGFRPIVALMSFVLAFFAISNIAGFGRRAQITLVYIQPFIVTVIGILLFHFWFSPVLPLLGVLLTFIVWEFTKTRVVARFMRDALSQYKNEPIPQGISLPDIHSRNPDILASQAEILLATLQRGRALRDLIASVAQGLPDPTVVMDHKGQIQFSNLGARQTFSRGKDVTPSDITDFFAVDELGAPAFSADEMAGPNSPWQGERRGTDGTIRDIKSIEWTPEPPTQNGWIVRFADVTPAKMEEKRREDYLQVLSHDMRSPLAHILRVLRQGSEQLSPAIGKTIGHYTSRALELIDAYLSLARADARTYALEPLELTNLILEVIDDEWPHARARGIDIVKRGFDVDRDYLVRGDWGLLRRAFANLLDNAVKFSPDGGQVTVSLDEADPSTAPHQLRITIADHGAGIAPEAIPHIFERFRSSRPADDGGATGMGLGLAFVKAVAEGHMGDIQCESTVNEGSRFIFSLPCSFSATEHVDYGYATPPGTPDPAVPELQTV